MAAPHARLLLLISCLCALVVAGPSARAVQAQTPLVLATLQIQLWPEYDRAETLVILDGQLAAGTALPAALSVRIPAAAVAPHAVAVWSAAGQLLTAPYTTAPAEQDIIVTFSTDALGFRVEYYDPDVTREGGVRALDFSWTSDYAVAAAAVRVQQPAGATGLTGEPALTALGLGEDGLSYFQRDLGAVPAGGTVTVAVRYTKSSEALTAEVLGAPAASAAGTTVAATSWPLLAAGGAVGLGLLGGGIYLALRGRPAKHGGARSGSRPSKAPVAQAARRRTSRRRAPTPAARPKAARAAERPREVSPRPAPAAGPAYCTQCGGGLQADDRFCRQCGAPVRRGTEGIG